MTWFDRSGQRKVKTAVFPDRSPPKKPVPAWIPERASRPSSLSTWLSQRPPPRSPSTSPPPNTTRHSQPPPPPPKPAPPQTTATRPSLPPPAPRPPTTAEALEAKSLSLEQRESMMPRASMPGPLPPLPADMLLERTRDGVDLAAQQAVFEAKIEAFYETKVESAMTTFENGMAELASLKERTLSQAEENVVLLAAALARRVIGREISLDPSILVTLAAEGAEALGERDRIVVRVAPFDDEQIARSLWERLKRRIPRCELMQDPDLAKGQCFVESELGRVDESIDSRLDNVLAAILPLPSATTG